MTYNVVVLIAKQFFKKAFFNKGLFVLLTLFILALTYVTINGWQAFEAHDHSTDSHQDEQRESWESNPDKHPHRMAHFGSFVFRQQHPLSIFDSGIENYTGNTIFLEAHKQNTANFSEASLSTGLVRFGDLNIALLLQLILPLIIFFIGYGAITSEKENGTLKVMYLQGTTMKQIILGKSLGLFFVTALFFIPALIALWSIMFVEVHTLNAEVFLRSVLISISYILFFLILCSITVIISAKSKNSNKALLSLLGAWLLFFIIIPKTAQVIGNYLYPNKSKIEFTATIEDEVIKQGDSHNPDDVHFKKLRDSVLKAHNVKNVNDLPFNYSGFLMSKGEETSAKIYANEHNILINTYKKQNSITNGLVMFNPYLAIKNVSMGLSGTDFHTYTNFLTQTENFRYKQSQFMNELQMKFISNSAKGSEGKVHVIKKEYWQSFPKFQYEYLTISQTLKHHFIGIIGLVAWLLLMLFIITNFSNRFKII
ncbi:DUF3526 domain-containing protein [Seonamhaeicola algicola]|uniref:DUF3526 domain-containing protein n=1 Tax=Seonamhaeicola algicola TaxID=1719036 RepID=A0A5C7B063_9FLAO|nr:DUF3526 domain-containing protein [Seonamhaeicola algicola]TXE13864.1 DUF3526 domain-containing protein [Seonamhaeicola algicola]